MSLYKKIDKIVVFGDSFPAGLLKHPDGTYNSYENQQSINFVTQIGQLLKWEIENYGRPGNSNSSISYDVFKYFSTNLNHSSTLYLICWSGFFRTHTWDLDEKRFTPEHIQQEIDREDYMREIAQLYAFIFNTYSLLKSKQVNFLFCSSFIDYHKIDNSFITNLIKDTEDSWLGKCLPNTSLLMAAGKNYLSDPNKFSLWNNRHEEAPNFLDSEYIYSCGHPTEKGHTEIAKILITEFKNLFYIEKSLL